MLHPLAG
jgi:L-fuconate dehydratase